MKKIATLLLAVVLVAAMAVPAFAASFTPSVENKGAPTVEKVVDKDEGDFSGELIVTPVKDKDTTTYTAGGLRLEAVYGKLEQYSLRSLCKVSAIGGVPVDDLVVRDLFDVGLTGDDANYFNTAGNYLKITFKVSDASSLVGASLFSVDGEKWSILEGTDMVKNADGTVTITIRKMGVVAFLYDNGTIPDRNHKKNTVDDGEHYAPQTSDPTWQKSGSPSESRMPERGV